MSLMRTVFLSLSGSGRLQDVLAKVYGLDVARQMIAVDAASEGGEASAESGIAVGGYAGLPSLHRSCTVGRPLVVWESGIRRGAGSGVRLTSNWPRRLASSLPKQRKTCAC